MERKLLTFIALIHILYCNEKDIRKIYYWKWDCSLFKISDKTDEKIGRIYVYVWIYEILCS